jgi:tRNA(fMet)-specific endonuclease VapC
MTGNSCLLDTSIIIYSFKVSEIKHQLDDFEILYIPSIAVGELYYGAFCSANPTKHIDQVNAFINNCTVLSADATTGMFYGQIKSGLKAKGKPIPENDIWIASLAAQHKLPVFTKDKHFKEIEIIDLI